MNFSNSWFSRFFSAEFAESSKRMTLLVLVAVFVIQFFLIMYIKVEIANKDLVKNNIYYLVVLIGVFGGFVSMEVFTNLFKRKAELQAGVDTEKAKAGTPDTKVQVDNVENVNADTVKMEPQPDK
jgi:hypothetical protein